MSEFEHCSECDGLGTIEVDEVGVPRSAWESIPKASRLAYDMGMVDFTEKPCTKCDGTVTRVEVE